MTKVMIYSILMALCFLSCKDITEDQSMGSQRPTDDLFIIQVDDIIKQNIKGASGVNASFLNDSDKHYPRKTSTKDSFKNIGVGSIRYPYGHLADNYLWTVPPYDNTLNGLHPKVASMSLAPAKWEWAIDSNGFFKKDLGFDDYVAMCKELGVEPLIVVNVLSFQYTGGPTLDELIESAAQWVKYANVTKKYGIKYWQLGNEVEHEKGKAQLTKEKYSEIYSRMASAMKKQDPTIKVGTGILSNPVWNRYILSMHFSAHLVDFISCHQYTWGIPLNSLTYEGWKEYKTVYIPNVVSTEKVLSSNPDWKDVEILITETNVTGATWSDGKTANLYKALLFYEMNIEQLSLSHVKYSYFWSSHSPWNGEFSSGMPLENVFTDENDETAMGKMIGFINQYMLPCILNCQIAKGYLRIRATSSENGKYVNVFVLNKGSEMEEVKLSFKGNGKFMPIEKVSFVGKYPEDPHPRNLYLDLEGNVEVSPSFTDIVSPCCLTVFRFEKIL